MNDEKNCTSSSSDEDEEESSRASRDFEKN